MVIRSVVSSVISSVVSSVIGRGSGSGGDTVPFTDYDANTLFFDHSSASNTVDTLGDDTYSYIPEKIYGVNALFQNVKDLQPIKEANGISFRQATNRNIVLLKNTGIANGTNGFYWGDNIFIPSDTTAVDNEIFQIKAVSGNTSSRGRIAYSSTGKIDVRYDATRADGAITAQLVSATLTKGFWYTVEVAIDFTAGTKTLKINGSTVDSGSTATGTFPASDPVYVLFGNDRVVASATTDSCNGTLQKTIFQNAAPTSAQLTAFGAYLNSIRIRVPDATTITASTGNGFINVSVPDNSVGNGNSAITNHKLRYKIEGGGYTTIDTGSATPPTTLSDAGIVNDTEYFVSHLRSNAIGDSAWSSDVSAIPTASPGAPDAIDDLAVFAGATQIVVQWTKPNSNGYTISTHKLYYRITGSGSAFTLFSSPATGSGTLSATITGLSNGTSYEVDVRSVNSIGESASASPTVSATPVAAPNIQSIVSSAVMDIDFTVAACYGGTGLTCNNLVVSPADGSAQSAYNIQMGDGSTSSTYPTFSGTAGTSAGKLTFDGGDHMTLVGSNTTFLDNLHKSTGGTDFTVLMFFENLVNKASNQIMFTTRNGSGAIGMSGLLNSSEVLRIEQRGDTTVVNLATPPTTVATLGSPTYLGFAEQANGGTGSASVWNETSTAQTSNHTYNATTTNAAQKLHFCASANATGNVANGTVLKAICMFNTKLSNAEVASVAAEYSTRHGVTY